MEYLVMTAAMVERACDIESRISNSFSCNYFYWILGISVIILPDSSVDSWLVTYVVFICFT